MKRIALFNIGFNVLLATVFVALNVRALTAGFEETFVSLALFYSLITVLGNAIFVAYARR